MLFYRGKAFCNKDDCCKRNSCSKYFTKYHKKNAEKLGLPVQFIKEPECYKVEK